MSLTPDNSLERSVSGLTVSHRAIALVVLLGFAVRLEAQPPACHAESGRPAEQVQGEVQRGNAFKATTSDGWIVHLTPASEGWLLAIASEDRPNEDLSRLTPPWHFTPNPRQIDGWHFRNADNTGPNDGSVNAPQEYRDFIFSPRAGRDIQGPGANDNPAIDDVNEVRAFGRGWLHIESYRLTPATPGERAAFESMKFAVCLTWAG